MTSPAIGRREAVAWVLGAALLAVPVFGTRWGVFTPDTRPDLYLQPHRFLATCLDAWVQGSGGLGQANFNAGAAPLAVVIGVIRWLGASPWLAVRIWRYLLLLVAGAGMHRYLRVLLGAALQAPARAVGTVFWMLNPYAVVGGSTTPILLPYALLPWMLAAFVTATRRPRSWRWPAWFALAFLAQSGANAGVVPLFGLLALPAHLLHARWVEHRRWPDLALVLARCGVLSLAVSCYWLLPSVLASGTGAGIAASTENPRDVARTSSFAEVARLLGGWPLYGRAGPRLFLGGYTVYLTAPAVMLASFAVPVVVGLVLWRSRSRARPLIAALWATALPVMVGLFPPDRPSPLGRLLGAVFHAVPASLAFRTTNKVGAVAALAAALAVAVAAQAMRPSAIRWCRRPGGRALLWGVAALSVLALSLPFWNGSLYPLGYRIPSRWSRAVADLDARSTEHRVLVLPGGSGGNYRWGMRSPDDLFPSLLARPFAVRSTVAGRGEVAGNFLAGFDTDLARGALPSGAVSVAARTVGATDVLVRNDLLSEEIGGATPSAVAQQLVTDPGLRRLSRYGHPGTDTLPGHSGTADAVARSLDPRDAARHPLETYRVTDPEPAVRVGPVGGGLLVDGDGAALPALAGLGLADGHRTVRYLGSLDTASLIRAAREGDRLVLTDTNRRRAAGTNRVAGAESPTLAADQGVDGGDGASLTLWPDDPVRQTVTETDGARSATADHVSFGLTPSGRPGRAFDGDPTTAWIVGGLGTARGARLTVTFVRPRVVDRVVIHGARTEPSRVTRIALALGSTRLVRELPPGGAPLRIDVPGIRAGGLSITVLGQSAGRNPVGISEVEVAGLHVTEYARLPRTLDRLVAAGGAPVRRALRRMPVDIVLARARGVVADPSDDEEAELQRHLHLPLDRTYRLRGRLAASGVLVEALAEARAFGGTGACRPVALLDGRPLLARIMRVGTRGADPPVSIEGCEPVRLAAGGHELTAVFGWRLDLVRLSAPAVVAPSAPHRPAPTGGTAIRTLHRTATRIDLEIPHSSNARYLRLGQGFDPRWSASFDGRSLGPPILLDGYSVGWRLPPGGGRLTAVFAPQRALAVGFRLSGLAVLGVVVVAILARRGPDRRRRPTTIHRPVRATPRGPLGLVGWCALVVAAVLLDGWVGLGVAVFVAAVVLARLPVGVLGAVGVAFLVAVPLAEVAGGLPATSTLSPAFVRASLVPHHLMFIGLCLTVICAVLQTRPGRTSP